MRGKPLRIILPTNVRNDRAAEVHSLASLIHDNLRRIGIEQCPLEIVVGTKRLHQSSYLGRLVGETGLDSLYLLRMDKRLIALDIHDDIVTHPHLLVRLVATIRAAPVPLGGHHHLSAKRMYGLGDPLVIGRYTHRVQRILHSLIYPLYHGFTKHIRQRFPRKAARRVTRRNDSYKSHLRINYDFRFQI